MIGRFSGAALMWRVRRRSAAQGLCASLNVLLCAAAMTEMGWAALGALVLTSFFMSIMFPTIFALASRISTRRRPLGSSFIIMAIIGGAIFPPLMGVVAERMGGVPVAPACAAAGLLRRDRGLRRAPHA